MEPEPFAKNQEIPGTPYKYVALLGRGGQGVVVEVEHSFLGSRAVMKLLNPQHVERQDLSGRMQDEARALAAIRHPNIVRVTDGGITAEAQPRPFFVMEKLEGDTLLAIVRRRVVGLPLRSAIAIAAEVLDALDVAHVTHRMIHRDVKPGNVFLARVSPVEVRAVLLDFGVARMKKPSSYTGENAFVGTFQYAAPEQLRGTVTPQSDLYALGLMLFELIVGRHPFADAANVPDWIRFQTSRVPPRVDSLRADVPRALADLVTSALAKDPKDRPASALAFASELRMIRSRFLENETPEAATEEMAVEQVVALMGTVVPPTARLADTPSKSAPHQTPVRPPTAGQTTPVRPASVPDAEPPPAGPHDPNAPKRRATQDLPPETARPAVGLRGTARLEDEAAERGGRTLAMEGIRGNAHRPQNGPPVPAIVPAGNDERRAVSAREVHPDGDSWSPSSHIPSDRNLPTVVGPKKSSVGLIVGIFAALCVTALAGGAVFLATRHAEKPAEPAASTAEVVPANPPSETVAPPAVPVAVNSAAPEAAPVATTAPEPQAARAPSVAKPGTSPTAHAKPTEPVGKPAKTTSSPAVKPPKGQNVAPVSM